MLNANAKPTAKLAGLQVLRGVAALLVMWCHLKYNLGVPATSVSKTPLLSPELGAIGADIFFVISGFVIAMTAAKLGDNWRLFLVNRLARIVPLYFALSTCLFAWASVMATLHGFPVDVNFRQIFNTYAFIPLFDTANFTHPWIENGWTLSFELWFYLAFGCFIKIFNGRTAGRILPVFMAVGVLATVLCYHWNRWFLPKFLFHPLTLDFCAGCLLYHARNLIGKKQYASWSPWEFCFATWRVGHSFSLPTG